MKGLLVFIGLLLAAFWVSGYISYLKYPDEMKAAYESLHEDSQQTIGNWKKAKVKEQTIYQDYKVMNDDNNLVNIKGMGVLRVTFKGGGDLGPIQVFLDEKTGEVLGVAQRK